MAFDFYRTMDITSRNAHSRSMSLDPTTVDLVGERIATALCLDKPAEVRNKKQGFYVPFHAKDAKKYDHHEQV